MFIQDFQIIERRYDELVVALTAKAQALLGDALDTARFEGERLRVKVGPPGWPALVGKTVKIRPGRLRAHGDGVLLAFSWEAHGGASLFPRLDADLAVAPLGMGQTQIVLRARYEPPGGALGRNVDRLLLHRVAESTLRAFLERLCSGLDGREASPRAAGRPEPRPC
ncbi:MAG: hypothetical protein JWO62_1384 [Acidimicrobiaceae bacterium]|jgi:hypothetical protein|nr:hypothetical protein [Acidimicrobiaceae bacterium]